MKIVLYLLTLLTLLLPTTLSANDKGGNLYFGHCAKCHGRGGEGFLKLYPPIRNTRYLKEDVTQLPCIIRNGLKGEIVVDGVTFNQIMPAIPRLKAEEIEQIIGYLQKTWNHPVTPLDTETWLKSCQ